MNAILKFIEEMRQDSSINYKLSVLEKYKDVPSVTKLLQYTYESRFNYYITKLPDYEPSSNNVAEEEFIWELLDSLRKREFTGNAAKELVKRVCMELRPELVEVLQLILDKNLGIGIDTKSINKVIPNLISSTPYMRCTSSLDEKLIQKFESQEQGFYTQKKADGAFSYIIVDNEGVVQLLTRNGTWWYSPMLQNALYGMSAGVYVGEALVAKSLEDREEVLSRKESNGLVNKLIKQYSTLDSLGEKKGYESKQYIEKQQEFKDIDARLMFECWDYLTLEEFDQQSSTTPYALRFEMLKTLLQVHKIDPYVMSPIETTVCKTIAEAQAIANDYMAKGFEGAVIKTRLAHWKDGTNKDMVKIKAELSCELKCVGIKQGKGKYKGMIGSIICESADGRVKVDVNLRTDEDRMQPDDFYLDKIIEVKYNEKVDSKSKDGVWSLFLPVFMGIRFDKDVADKFEEIL